MKHEVIPPVKRRATNVTLPEDLVAQARELGVNLSKACEIGLADSIRSETARRWKVDNAAWIAAHRQWVDGNELPLESYRLF